MRKSAIIAAVITGTAIIVAAFIGIYPSLRKPKAHTVIAGIVVDQDTNEGIRQAIISIAGRTEEYVTEDNGNFRIDLPEDALERLRLHVTKSGYQPLDQSVQPPHEGLVLQLRKQ